MKIEYINMSAESLDGDCYFVDENTVMISAGLVAFSYVLVPFHDKRMKSGEKWRIKVLNMSMDEDVPNPFRQ